MEIAKTSLGRRIRAVIAMGLGIALLPVMVCRAQAQLPTGPGPLCRSAIRQAEIGSSLPANLLAAIARVESGRRDPATRQVDPWPWTINAEGRGHFFNSKEEAIAFARELRTRGVQSFDVGCLQINLMHHPDAFASLEEAFEPSTNARYAVRFLQSLREKVGNWEDASAWYHSANPEYGAPYRGLVVNAMAEEAKLPPPSATPVQLAALTRPINGPAPMAMSSMPTRPGTLLMLARPSFATMVGGQGMLGRGLDAYRSMPVAIVGPRILASR